MIPPLVSSNVPLPRIPFQRPSRNVIGKTGYYCTDRDTPIFRELLGELLTDTSVTTRAVEEICRVGQHRCGAVCYAVTTHPGHHAAHDSFGGYCYLNNVALAARLFQRKREGHRRKRRDDTRTDAKDVRVAILDVDYHCGNGTASIFREDPSVLVVSLHCHPDFEYPFHSGFEDDTGIAHEGKGTTMHLPLPPGTDWSAYRVALERGLGRIVEYQPALVVVSLGLDTHDQDPCAIRRAGFCLKGEDYREMGKTIAEALANAECAEERESMPVLFVQEGGYRMDKIGKAATDVVTAFCETRRRPN